jgi:hypothetical protein
LKTDYEKIAQTKGDIEKAISLVNAEALPEAEEKEASSMVGREFNNPSSMTHQSFAPTFS